MSARILAAVVATAGALPITLIDLPTATAEPCPDVEVVFARGTTEPPGVGGVGRAFVESLRSQLGGRSVGVYAVNYPASNDFDMSTPAGAGDASTHIQSMAANCPNTRMVLGGYSQGAAVIDLSTTAMPPQVADHVAAGRSYSGVRQVLLRTHCPRDRYRRSARFTLPRPLTCAFRTIPFASNGAGTCGPTVRTSSPGWSTRPRRSLRVAFRRGGRPLSRVCGRPFRWHATGL